MSAGNWNGLPGGEHVSWGLVIAALAWFAIWCYWRWWNAREHKRNTDARLDTVEASTFHLHCEHQDNGHPCGARAICTHNGVRLCDVHAHWTGESKAS